jgi:predicted nucleic-acid-binding Zn-ribbon protein
MNEVKKCPKCGGKMEIGYLNNAWRWMRGKSRWQLKVGPNIYGHACENCGYVEFYLEKEGISHEQNV